MNSNKTTKHIPMPMNGRMSEHFYENGIDLLKQARRSWGIT
ncbi:hypothetical protein [Polyangium sp. 6x1]|nr:hypothetical protein [Polyangium sp. 6x1]MDI1444658.1 hypothetical protein [Polyangium sp. 6x1]